MFYLGKCLASLVVSVMFVSLFLVDVNILLPLTIDFELAAGLVVGFVMWAAVLMHLLLVNRWQSILLVYFISSITLAVLFLLLR